MLIPALSIASSIQTATQTSNFTGPDSAVQALKQSLADGDLTAAQTALTSLQKLNASQGAGGSAPANTQLTDDLETLGSAIYSGDLSSARQTFANVQTDLQNNPSLAIAAAVSAAQETVQWIDDLLSLSGSSPTDSNQTPSIADLTTSILTTAYGSGNSSSTSATSTDGTTATTATSGTSS